MKRFVAAISAVLLLAAAQVAARAADITLVSYRYSKERTVPHIRLTGVIREGDLERFTAVMEQAKKCAGSNCSSEFGGPWAVVSLASPGGHYITGIALADAFRANLAATVVESGDTCLSACAVAFLGGSSFWPTGGVGVYIDRTIEPAATVGWHSPLFPDEVVAEITDGGQAKLALDTTRLGISKMVELLTKYNVSPLVVDKIIGMGPRETYNADTAERLFYLRANLPTFPVRTLAIPFDDQFRNACARLAALHYVTDLETGVKAVSGEIVDDGFKDGEGNALRGIAIDDRPLNVAGCYYQPAGRVDDALLFAALYRLDGTPEANLEIVTSFQNGIDGGWSTAAYQGGSATSSVLALGPLNHFVMAPDTGLASLEVAVRLSIMADKAMDPKAQLPRFSRDLGLEVIGETDRSRVSRSGDVVIAEQVGAGILFDELAGDQGEDMEITYSRDFSGAAVRSGNDTVKGVSFYWLALRSDDRAATIRVEFPMPASQLTAAQKKLTVSLACSADFEGAHLPCYK